jgi:hypothetical protein
MLNLFNRHHLEVLLIHKAILLHLLGLLKNIFFKLFLNQNSFCSSSTRSTNVAPPAPGAAPQQQQQQPRTTPATGTTPTASQDSFLSAEAREKALNELTDMGFERTQAEQALRASFYHVERAAEYLITVTRKLFFKKNFLFI